MYVDTIRVQGTSSHNKGCRSGDPGVTQTLTEGDVESNKVRGIIKTKTSNLSLSKNPTQIWSMHVMTYVYLTIILIWFKTIALSSASCLTLI